MAHVKRLEALKKAEYRKAAAPASAESPVQTASVNPGGGIEGCIIAHESGGDSQVMNGSGHYGLFQFDEQTWVSGGGNPGGGNPGGGRGRGG